MGPIPSLETLVASCLTQRAIQKRAGISWNLHVLSIFILFPSIFFGGFKQVLFPSLVLPGMRIPLCFSTPWLNWLPNQKFHSFLGTIGPAEEFMSAARELFGRNCLLQFEVRPLKMGWWTQFKPKSTLLPCQVMMFDVAFWLNRVGAKLGASPNHNS